MVVSVCIVGILNSLQVDESREMPPLPVSNIKLSVSFTFSKQALITITPPLNCLKGKLVIYSATGCGDKISWARELRVENNRNNMAVIYFMAVVIKNTT